MVRHLYDSPLPRNDARKNFLVAKANDILWSTVIRMPTKTETLEETEEAIKWLHSHIQSFYLARISPQEILDGNAKESVALIKAKMNKEQRQEHREGVDELLSKYSFLTKKEEKEEEKPETTRPTTREIMADPNRHLNYMLECLEAWEKHLEYVENSNS